jgi:hypothetical protein
MGKKVRIGLSYVLIVILIIIIIVSLLIYKSNLDFAIIARGNKKYGNEYCTTDEKQYYKDMYSMIDVYSIYVSYTCELCNKEYNDYYSSNSKICPSCSDITKRCQYCGKLFQENIEI